MSRANYETKETEKYRIVLESGLTPFHYTAWSKPELVLGDLLG